MLLGMNWLNALAFTFGKAIQLHMFKTGYETPTTPTTCASLMCHIWHQTPGPPTVKSTLTSHKSSKLKLTLSPAGESCEQFPRGPGPAKLAGILGPPHDQRLRLLEVRKWDVVYAFLSCSSIYMFVCNTAVLASADAIQWRSGIAFCLPYGSLSSACIQSLLFRAAH